MKINYDAPVSYCVELSKSFKDFQMELVGYQGAICRHAEYGKVPQNERPL